MFDKMQIHFRTKVDALISTLTRLSLISDLRVTLDALFANYSFACTYLLAAKWSLCASRRWPIHFVNGIYFQFSTKGPSVECIPPPHHIQIGTVSLPASCGCERVREVVWYWPLYQYSRRYAQWPRSTRNPTVAGWRHYDRLVFRVCSRAFSKFCGA